MAIPPLSLNQLEVLDKVTGRVILAKSTLNRIPTHLMQYIKLPHNTVEAINK